MTWIKKHRIEIHIFLILLICYTYFFPRWADWNQNSRLDLIMAIVDQGTVSIDAYYKNTGDYAIYKGRHYSTKAPGLSLLGVPIYWLFRQIVNSELVTFMLRLLSINQAFNDTLRENGVGLAPERIYFAIALYIVVICTVSLNSAFLGFIMYSFLNHYSSSSFLKLLVVLIYGVATPAFAYSSVFYSHQIVSTFLMLSFYIIFLISRKFIPRGFKSTLLLFFSGFLTGYSIITEYPSMIIAIGIFGYFAYRLYKKIDIMNFILFIIGNMIPIFIWMVYNYQIYGKLVSFGYLYAPLHIDKNNVGFFSLMYPHFRAIWGITFSTYRGLFFLSPVLILSFPGFYYFSLEKGYRSEFILFLYCFVGFILFNGSSVMWDGGFAVGPRYLIPALPFISLPLIFFMEKWGTRRWAQWLIAGLIIWSMLFVWGETIGGQSFPDWTPNPLINYSLPKLSRGDIARNWGTILGLRGWSSLMPLLVIETLVVGILIKHLRKIKYTEDR